MSEWDSPLPSLYPPQYEVPNDQKLHGRLFTEPLKRPGLRPGSGPQLQQLSERLRLLEQSQKRRGADLPKQYSPVVSGGAGVLTDVRILRAIQTASDLEQPAAPDQLAFFNDNGPFLLCLEMGFISQGGDDPVYKADPNKPLFVFTPEGHSPAEYQDAQGNQIFDASDDEVVFYVFDTQRGKTLNMGYGEPVYVTAPLPNEICTAP